VPLIQVKLIEGVFSDAQKQEMIRKLTDAMVSIEGETMREVTWVVVEEVKSGSWGIGGKALACSPFVGPVIMGVTCSLIQ
jgi:4-oxalocrotonate tautomerase